jgi:hypothetical protein
MTQIKRHFSVCKQTYVLFILRLCYGENTIHLSDIFCAKMSILTDTLAVYFKWKIRHGPSEFNWIFAAWLGSIEQQAVEKQERASVSVLIGGINNCI